VGTTPREPQLCQARTKKDHRRAGTLDHQDKEEEPGHQEHQVTLAEGKYVINKYMFSSILYLMVVLIIFFPPQDSLSSQSKRKLGF